MIDVEMLAVCAMTGGLTFGIVLLIRADFHRALGWVESDLDRRLRSLRIRPHNLHRWVSLWVGLVAATFLSIWLAANAFPIALALAVVMLAGPWYSVRRLASDRRQKIESQLADAMVMFSSAIRAGLSLAQALELLALECPRPICQEFTQITGEYKLGKPLDHTLTEAKERLKSENFLIFAAALMASRESGGRLNETVERIAQSVLELQRLERKVMSETAQARKSAVYMALVPPIILIVYSFVDPENLRLLFVTFPGQLILTAAFLLNLIAYFWALKIVQSDL